MWGTGKPKREFLHVDDLAEACYFLMQTYNEPGPINIGTGEDIPLIELANMIKEVVGYAGTIKHDLTKPDGTPRKLMDVSKLHDAGWKAEIPLTDGIKLVYEGLAEEPWY